MKDALPAVKPSSPFFLWARARETKIYVPCVPAMGTASRTRTSNGARVRFDARPASAVHAGRAAPEIHSAGPGTEKRSAPHRVPDLTAANQDA
jgi:hypothetical protein